MLIKKNPQQTLTQLCKFSSAIEKTHNSGSKDQEILKIVQQCPTNEIL